MVLRTVYTSIVVIECGPFLEAAAAAATVSLEPLLRTRRRASVRCASVLDHI